MKIKWQKISNLVAGSAILLTTFASLQKPVEAASKASLTTDNQSLTSAEFSSDSDTTRSAELISYYVDQVFLLNNDSPVTMLYFYASPSDAGSWEEDILGSSVLGPYESSWITIQDNRQTCRYDFRAIFSDGSESTHYGINICNLSEYTFN